MIFIDIPWLGLFSNPVQMEEQMTFHTTYTRARDGLANLFAQLIHDREVVVLQRGGEDEMAMLAATELESLMETAHLLNSPVNAECLLSELGRALKIDTQPINLASLRNEGGLE